MNQYFTGLHSNKIPMLQQKQKSLNLIQLLRGIASILVVLLHITINYEANTGNQFLFNIFRFGGSGVDIFFVLSGFIITYANLRYLEQPSSVMKFLKRRFIRIFPIYWLVISGLLLLQLLLPTLYNTHFDTGLANILQTYLLLPGHIMLNGVSWSLTNELFFYLLFVLALLIPNKKITFYMMLAYLALLIVFALKGPPVIDSNEYARLLLFPMNIEFFLGVLIVLIVNRLSKKLVYPLLISGILLFILGAMLHNGDVEVVGETTDMALSRVLLFGLPAFLVILAVVKIELNRTVNLHNIFLQLGDASYSIYLIHLPIVAAFFKVFVNYNINNTWLIFLLSCVLIIIICAAGIFIYHYVEKPLIKKLNQLLL